MSATPPCTTDDAGTPRAATTSVSALPNELLVAVFSHLDASSSLEPRFRDDASTLMDAYYAARGPHCRRRHHHHPSRGHPLKSASLVCRRWRAAVLPRLFRHVLWTLRRLEEPSSSSSPSVHGEGFEVLAFLQRHGLRGVESIMLHVPCPEHLIDDPTELVGRYGLVPSTVVQQREDEGEEDAESVVLSETASLVLAEGNGHATWANTWFWDMLFAVVDPLRVSILAAPVVLATMLSRKVYTQCQPLMMTRYHLLSVSRPDRSPPPPEDDDDDDSEEEEEDDDDASPQDSTATTRSLLAPLCDNLPCELFARRRRWTALLANESSSVSIYKSDAYGAVPPSPLLSLLASRDPRTRRFLRRSLRRLAYIAVMPMATHVQSALLVACPALRLEELFIQVMPPGVDIAHDGHGAYGRFEGLDMEDLVMERDSVYGLLFACIFIPGPQRQWEALRVFETGDAEGDEVAWAEAVETVQASTSWWDVERRGRFVRNLAREQGRRRNKNADLPMQSLSPPPL